MRDIRKEGEKTLYFQVLAVSETCAGYTSLDNVKHLAHLEVGDEMGIDI